MNTNYQYPTDLIKIGEAATILNLKPGTIYNGISDWSIPFIRIGNKVWFSIGELKEYLMIKDRGKTKRNGKSK